MTSIRRLISNVQDINSGSRYEVIILPPSALRIPRNIDFYCQKCTVPGVQMSQIDSIVYGQGRKIPGIRKSEMTCSTSHMFDYKAENIRFIEQWFELITPSGNKRVNYYDNIIGSMEINVLNNLNNPLLKIELTEVYPVKISELGLSYTNEEYLPIDIEWHFRERKLYRRNSTGDFETTSLNEGRGRRN